MNTEFQSSSYCLIKPELLDCTDRTTVALQQNNHGVLLFQRDARAEARNKRLRFPSPPPVALTRSCSPLPSILFDLTSQTTNQLTDRSDAFAMRQFTDPSYTGTKVAYDPQEFEDKVRHSRIWMGRDGYIDIS